MTQAPRYPIDELIAEYTLHSDRKHIYVEGVRDKAFFEWHIKNSGLNDVEVFAIERIDVPKELIDQEHQENSNRGRLITLAKQLKNRLNDNGPQVLCIVDADFDWVLDGCLNNQFLAYTDGTSIEMFAYSAQPLQRVLSLALGVANPDADTVLNAIRHVLRDLSLVRATNKNLNCNLSWLSCSKRLKFETNGSLAIDVNKYIKDYLSNGNRLKELTNFMVSFEALKDETIDFDDIKVIRGHDFAETLYHYLKKHLSANRIKNITPKALEAMVLMSIEESYLQDTDLFMKIFEVFNQ